MHLLCIVILLSCGFACVIKLTDHRFICAQCMYTTGWSRKNDLVYFSPVRSSICWVCWWVCFLPSNKAAVFCYELKTSWLNLRPLSCNHSVDEKRRCRLSVISMGTSSPSFPRSISFAPSSPLLSHEMAPLGLDIMSSRMSILSHLAVFRRICG